MKTVDIGGLRVNSTTRIEVLDSIAERIKAGHQTSVITPYSEFLVAGLRHTDLMELFNKATFSLPDGIGILWAEKFLAQPFTAKSYYRKIIEAFWQMVWTGASIVLKPRSLYSVFPEKIVGADLFWDLCKLAEQESFSMYLLGAEHDVPAKASRLLKERFPRLQLLGSSNKIWDDPTILGEINELNPDMVLVFFPYRKQERWIFENLPKLKTKFIIGLGGTLDYAVGEKLQPPRLIRNMGLEWLFRLITQPYRLKRIWTAFVGLIVALMRYKVFMTTPFRKNVVAVIINSEQKILICQRNPQGKAYGSDREGDHAFVDYWQFPQGGVNRSETIIDGARREAFEETGLRGLEVIKHHDEANSYLWRNAARRLLFNPLKFKGQIQSVVYFRFEGNNDDVKLDNDEFVAYQWVEKDEISRHMHRERQSLVEVVLADLHG